MKPVVFDAFWSFILFAAACIYAAILMGGCDTIGPRTDPTAPGSYNAHGRKLVIVAPSGWQSALTGYIQSKRDDGFVVATLNAEAEQTALAADLTRLHPDFVFLVGDQSLIPTVFQCTDISSWSPAYARGCTYSDSWLGDFIVGRLLTHDYNQLTNYVLMAAAYRARASSHRAYLVSDRIYESDDFTALDVSRRLGYAGVVSKLDVVNLNADPFIEDGAGEADGNTVAAAIDQGVDFIGYYGHGSAPGWGYLVNINRLGVTPALGAVIPLVFAMACETARAAPNPPWYPYIDADGYYESVFPGPPLVPADQIPDPASVQPWPVLNNTIAGRLTSELGAGAMVYIGETVVTGAETNLLDAVVDGVAAAYKTPTTIGDIWARAAPKGHPDIWQIVGDPSTFFLVAE